MVCVTVCGLGGVVVVLVNYNGKETPTPSTRLENQLVGSKSKNGATQFSVR